MKDDPIVMAAFERLAQKAEPKLQAALARHGASSPDQLPPELASKIFNDVLLQTAAENFPEARLDALKHSLNAFHHPHFGPAYTRLKAQLTGPSDAFGMAVGPDAAIVVAAFGLAVAPFDRKQPRMLAVPSNDLDEVAERFSRYKSAFVGYSPCDVPFYVLLTDCMRTAGPQIEVRPELFEVNKLLKRSGIQLPPGPFEPFQHCLVMIPREPGDTISTVFLHNPNPNFGSVALYAGWNSGVDRFGAPNEGFIPVPLRFLEAALQDPEFAMWIWRPVGGRVVLLS